MMNNEDIQGQSGEEIRIPDITYKPGYNKLDSFNWLNDLPVTIKEDDIVLTTSLGGNFPKGLLVGKVKNIKTSDTEPFQKAEVYSFLKIDDIKIVFAVTSF